jgi:hypothetical protein
MRKFIFGIVAVAAVAVVAGFATGKAAAAPSCYASVQTPTGHYHGVVTTNYHTTCPFARNVAQASLLHVIAAGGRYHGSFTTSAYSPVTYLWYRVRCSAYGDLFNGAINVDCRAGIGARVVYRAWSY